MQVVGELAIGANFGLLETGEDRTGVLEVLRNLLWYNSVAGQMTSLVPLLYSKPMAKLRAYLSPSSASSMRFRAWVAQQVNTRLENADFVEQGNERSDMLAMFRRAREPTTGEVFSVPSIFRECFTVLLV